MTLPGARGGGAATAGAGVARVLDALAGVSARERAVRLL